MQVFGATGISQWTPLARMYAGQRTLRLADGPDEVHWHVVGRAELARYESDTLGNNVDSAKIKGAK
jgi:acyl-CoA dehydrogenase